MILCVSRYMTDIEKKESKMYLNIKKKKFKQKITHMAGCLPIDFP